MPPAGITDRHQRPAGGWHRHASPLSLVVFGSVVLLGFSGLLGHEQDWRAAAEGTILDVHAPRIIRNGEFLEMRISVSSDRPLDELVIGIDATLWEDLTVNTMIPAPSDERSVDGELRFTFASMDAGTEFLWKVDLQVNPDIVFGNDGTVTVYEGDAPIVSTDLSVTVLP